MSARRSSFFCSFLFVALLAACGAASKSDSGAGAPPTDASTSSNLRDGGFPGSDSDAGTTGDAGMSSCVLGTPIHLSEGPSSLNLYGVAASPTHYGVALGKISSTGTERQLRLLDSSGMPTVSAPLKATAPELIPVGVDFADGQYALAGNDESGSRPKELVTFVDEAAKLVGPAVVLDHLAMAVAREKDGARTLAVVKNGSTGPLAIVSDRFDTAPSLSETVQVGSSPRGTNFWDLDWSDADDEGLACGLRTEATGDMLTLFALKDASSTAIATTEPLAAAPATGDSKFGCRVAATKALAAVIVDEGEARPRLVWESLAAGQATLAGGPVPLLPAYVTPRQLDVSISGGATAVAFLDNTGAARITVQVYAGPGAVPVVLRGDEGLNLGAFSSGRVRLSPTATGFLLAFDATPVGTQRADIWLRTITCQ